METPRNEFHRFQATGCQGMWRGVKVLICNFRNNVASTCFSQNLLIKFVKHIYFYEVQTMVFIRCTMKMHYFFFVIHRMLPTTKGYLYVLHQQAPLAQIKVKIDGTNIYILSIHSVCDIIILDIHCSTKCSTCTSTTCIINTPIILWLIFVSLILYYSGASVISF